MRPQSLAARLCLTADSARPQKPVDTVSVDVPADVGGGRARRCGGE